MSGIYRLFGGSKGGASGEEPGGGAQATPLIAKPLKKKFGALLSSAASRARATADETDAIRDAYAAGDVRASAAAHAAKAGSYGSADVAAAAAGEPAPEEDHGGQGSDYIKSIVFGGLDGIITTFAIIASVQGASQGLNVVLITGMAKLLGDGLAMGLGDAISEGAEQTYIRGERERERWELSNFPQGETAEMIEIYREKGFSEAEARAVIHTMTSKPAYAEYFIDHMMAQELSQLVPADDENPWFDGFVTFCSFMFFGVIPLLPYIGFYVLQYRDIGGTIGICAGVTIATLFALGATQAYIIRQNMIWQGLLMAINGSVAAAAAFGIGKGLQVAFGITVVCNI